MAFNTNPSRAEYIATASQTAFPFLFKIYTETDLKVYQTPSGNTPDDAVDILILNTDYTVTINGDEGGEITLISSASSGDILVLLRDLPTTREVDYQTNGDLLAETLDADQDYQTYLIMDGYTNLNKALLLPSSETAMSNNLPSTVNNAYVKVNSTGTAFEYSPLVISTDDVVTVSTISEMLLVDTDTTTVVSVLGYHAASDGGGGLFHYDATQSATNNGGTIIDGWVRSYSGAVHIKWFGAKCDGVTDDTTAITNAMTSHTNIEVEGECIITSIDITMDDVPYELKGNGKFIISGTGITFDLPNVYTERLLISGLSFEPSAAATGRALKIYKDIQVFQQEMEVIIDKCNFGHNGNTNFFTVAVTIDNVQQVRVTSCSIRGISTDATAGIGIDIVNQCTDISFNGLMTYHLNRAIRSYSKTEGIRLTGCTFVKPWIGIDVDVPLPDTVPYVSVTSCHINALQNCILLSEVNQVIVSDNLFYLRNEAEVNAVHISLNACVGAIIRGNLMLSLNATNSQTAIKDTGGSSCDFVGNIFYTVSLGVVLSSTSEKISVNNKVRTNATTALLGADNINNKIKFGGGEYSTTVYATPQSITTAIEAQVITPVVSNDEPQYNIAASGNSVVIPEVLNETYQEFRITGSWESNSAGSRTIKLFMNSVELKKHEYQPVGIASFSIDFGKTKVVEGDTFEVYVLQDSGITLQVRNVTLILTPTI